MRQVGFNDVMYDVISLLTCQAVHPVKLICPVTSCQTQGDDKVLGLVTTMDK